MADDDDLLYRPIAELAALVRDGEVTARELAEISLSRIEALEPHINAFTHVGADGALAAADEIAPGDTRPFAGVPIAIKDNMPVEGLPLTFCADLFGDFRADHDAFYVRALREAGFVIVGKTALPEYGILPTTESRRNGPTRNPWDRSRTPGGSSGGSAAAVAAGMVPIAHGNDGGGSTRIPASCCGLVGLKLSRGRASWGPDLGESFLVTNGVLTRTVAETAQVLDLTAGYRPGDATWAPEPPEPFAATAAREPGRLRIGITATAALDSVELDPECERAYREAADALAELGHEVEEFTPAWNMPGLLELFSASFGPGVASTIAFAAIVAGRQPAHEDMEDLSWHMWERASALPSQNYLLAMTQLQRFARELVVASSAYDVLLTPALAERPVEIGLINGVTDDPQGTFRRSGQFTPYTAIANTTGQPAISLPLRHGDDGLPAAIQLIGRPAGEGQLLALAAQLEAARPWADRRAPVEALSV
jgi:amidase